MGALEVERKYNLLLVGPVHLTPKGPWHILRTPCIVCGLLYMYSLGLFMSVNSA